MEITCLSLWIAWIGIGRVVWGTGLNGWYMDDFDGDSALCEWVACNLTGWHVTSQLYQSKQKHMGPAPLEIQVVGYRHGTILSYEDVARRLNYLRSWQKVIQGGWTMILCQWDSMSTERMDMSWTCHESWDEPWWWQVCQQCLVASLRANDPNVWG